jgi:hypothetical protein
MNIPVCLVTSSFHTDLCRLLHHPSFFRVNSDLCQSFKAFRQRRLLLAKLIGLRLLSADHEGAERVGGGGLDLW